MSESTTREPTTRESILDAAKQCVCTDREGQYGSPEDNFALIAKLWSKYLYAATGKKIEVSAHDVAAMMSLLKIARIATGAQKQIAGSTWPDTLLAAERFRGGPSASEDDDRNDSEMRRRWPALSL